MIDFIIALGIWFVLALNGVPRTITFAGLMFWTYSSLTVFWLVIFWAFLIYTYMLKGGNR